MAGKSPTKSALKGELDLNWVLKYLRDGVYPSGLNFSDKRMVRKRAERFCYLNGELFYMGTPTDIQLGKKSRKVLLTNEERCEMVALSHTAPDGSHYGLEKTADAITTIYHWVGIYRFIKDYIRRCPVCVKKHPKMLAPVKEASEDATESLMGDDDISCSGDEGPEIFWEKVDLRLLGPYKSQSSTKYVLAGIDTYSLWPEAYVLDTVCPSTVANGLLHMICRYGQMTALVNDRENVRLEAALTSALSTLASECGMHIALQKGSSGMLDAVYKEMEHLLAVFVKKHPKTWVDSFQYCLLPLRISRHKRADYTPSFLAHYREPVLPDSLTHNKGGRSDLQLTSSEKVRTVDSLMAVHEVFSHVSTAPQSRTRPETTVSAAAQSRVKPETTVSTAVLSRSRSEAAQSTTSQSKSRPEPTVFTPPPPSPRNDVNSARTDHKQGYVTRSRTGNAKPKSLDDDTFEVTPKRRAVGSSAEMPARKRVKVETIPQSSPGLATLKDDMDASDTESEGMSVEESPANKKPVDLDTYYLAIRQYVAGDGYPDRSSSSFKRLIRDQAKNYVINNGDLYHEVGSKGIMKRIIMTKEERIRLLTETHLKTANKTQMFAMLESVHWKGKVIDCEAFVLACPHCENYEQKPSKESNRHLAEAKKLLQFDTFDTYTEISNYIVYDVFSDDATSKRLDHLKRQLKNFRVEDGDLIHVQGNKKRRVITDGPQRQQAISEAHLKKGTHADLTGTFNQLSETVFWFGMKMDVKIYINYCCASVSDNKHLLERYFLFREQHMREPLSHNTGDGSGAEVEDESVTVTETPEPTDTAPEETDDETNKPPGTFTSTVLKSPSPVPDVSALDQLAATVTESGEMTVSEPGADVAQEPNSDVTTVVSAGGDTVQGTSVSEVTDIVPGTNMEAGVVDDEAGDSGTKITVVLTADGQTVLMGTPSVRKRSRASDDVTVAAVQSILGEAREESKDFVHMEHVEADMVSGAETPVVVSTASSHIVTVSGTQLRNLTGVQVTSPDGTRLTNPDGTELASPDGGTGSRRVSDAGMIEVGSLLNSGVVDTSRDETTEDAGRMDQASGADLDDDDDEIEDSDDEFLYDSDDDEDDEELYNEIKSDIGDMITTAGEGGSESGASPEKRVVTPRQHFKCNKCDKIFFGPIKFKMHMYKHTGQKPFPCNQCHKKYTNKKSLVTHQRTHTGELPYLCSLCGKRTPSKMALKSHLKCHDGNGGGFPAKCDVCLREFSRKHLMERHKLHKHTNAQTEFKCSECAKVFGHQRSLKRHFMSTHMGVKNHVCGLCGKGFYRKEYLTGHLIQHGGAAADGIIRKQRPSTFKPRPSVFRTGTAVFGDRLQSGSVKLEDGEEEDEGEEGDKEREEPVQRIILHQDEHGQLRVVDVATEREVKRMLEQQMPQTDGVGAETMVVHIEEPDTGEPQVVHVDTGEEQQVVPIEEQAYVEYQHMDGTRSQDYVISTPGQSSATTQYIYTSSTGEVVQGNQELVYGQPAVQYEVECVGDVGDEEALSAINLLAQASAQQYETVISNI